ncbi:Protein GrpE [Candidatus Saccharibacteria bacterium RAAC3_TM7_1]|nr:Protein GrpE [Candidatus Saccharibacteria bacterium RAAC3_TM7_1]HCZ28755.1 nucleotide exchange factor GrpE [Candidatus Saccharibacteria bacterium]
MAKSKKQGELEQQVAELTADLQRTRADFENYVRRIEQEKEAARSAGRATSILKLLPVIDNIERAIAHVPENLQADKWAQGVINLVRSLEKSLEGMNVVRINAKPGTIFNPELHEAIQIDEDAKGEHEVIAEELQAGYLLDGQPIRHAMVKVTRK